MIRAFILEVNLICKRINHQHLAKQYPFGQLNRHQLFRINLRIDNHFLIGEETLSSSPLIPMYKGHNSLNPNNAQTLYGIIRQNYGTKRKSIYSHFLRSEATLESIHLQVFRTFSSRNIRYQSRRETFLVRSDIRSIQIILFFLGSGDNRRGWFRY